MSGAILARVVGPVAPARGLVSHVFGDERVVDEQAARLGRVIDPRFLAECGWDPAGQVLAPPSDHPQLGWSEPVRPVCAVACAVGDGRSGQRAVP